MNFEKKKQFLSYVAISSFVFAALALIFGMAIVLFPDFILSFSKLPLWSFLIKDLRLFVVIWIFVSVVVQVVCGIFFIFMNTEERLKRHKADYIVAVILTAILGCFVTLGILVAQIILSVKMEEEKTITEREDKIKELRELMTEGKITQKEFETEAEKLIINNKK